jgi:NAD(P)-dependent dehydrogenase (short-subunit alcohol dehydrogenase family)
MEAPYVRRCAPDSRGSLPSRSALGHASAVSIAARLKKPGPSGFGYGSTAEEVTAGLDLRGRTYLVTGANRGLGLETLRVLALRGGHVFAAARTAEHAREALTAAGARGTALACDLSEPSSVRACVAQVSAGGTPLDAIVANAGVMVPRGLHRKHGYELHFLANHVGHFMLVTGLLGVLADRGRVVVVSSNAHFKAPSEGIQFDNLRGEREFGLREAYAHSKLANVLLAAALAHRMPRPGQTANSLHPGVIRTGIQRHTTLAAQLALALAGPVFLKSVAEGAATQCWAAAHPGASDLNGQYLSDCNPRQPSARARDRALQERLWEETVRIVEKL